MVAVWRIVCVQVAIVTEAKLKGRVVPVKRVQFVAQAGLEQTVMIIELFMAGAAVFASTALHYYFAALLFAALFPVIHCSCFRTKF